MTGAATPVGSPVLYLMRVGSCFGPTHFTVGRVISFVAMVGTWAALWFGFLRRRPLAAGVLGMAIAAALPASVHYGAVFPISTMLLAVMLAWSSSTGSDGCRLETVERPLRWSRRASWWWSLRSSR